MSRSLDIAQVRRAFTRDINMLIGEHATRRVFVHAGVVAVGDAAVLIPGRSFSGKTTLTKALVEQGAVYYSDEYAVLDSRGWVAPWAEPLSIRESGSREPAIPRSLGSLGIVAGSRRLEVRLVVLTSFEKGRRFKPGAVTPAAGALGLLAHTLPARRRPRSVLRAISLAAQGARVVRGPRGEAVDAARSILRLLEAPPK